MTTFLDAADKTSLLGLPCDNDSRYNISLPGCDEVVIEGVVLIMQLQSTHSMFTSTLEDWTYYLGVQLLTITQQHVEN